MTRRHAHAVTYVFVNQNAIKANQASKDANDARVISVVHADGRREECNAVHIDGSSRLVYAPDSPLPNGSRVWLETEAVVTTSLDMERKSK